MCFGLYVVITSWLWELPVASAFPARSASAAHSPWRRLEVVKVDAELNMIVVRGAIPGPKGGVVCIKNTVKNFKVKGAAAGISLNPQKASARVNPQKASARNR